MNVTLRHNGDKTRHASIREAILHVCSAHDELVPSTFTKINLTQLMKKYGYGGDFAGVRWNGRIPGQDRRVRRIIKLKQDLKLVISDDGKSPNHSMRAFQARLLVAALEYQRKKSWTDLAMADYLLISESHYKHLVSGRSMLSLDSFFRISEKIGYVICKKKESASNEQKTASPKVVHQGRV